MRANFSSPCVSPQTPASLARLRLVWGICSMPSLMMLVLLGTTAVRSGIMKDEGAAEILKHEAVQSLANRRFESARIAALRLSRFPAYAQAGELLECKALQGLGREKDSLNLLLRLAPETHPGHAPAHVMRAVIAASKQPPDLALAERQLVLALQSEPDNQDAHEMCARMAAGRSDWNTVIQHLKRAKIDERADLMLIKATALQANGQEHDAIALSRKAEMRLRALPGGITKENIGARYSIAISLNLQQKHQQAVDFLMNTCGANPTRQDRLAMADVYLAWSRQEKKQSDGSAMKALELLEKGIALCPESQELMAAYLDACQTAFVDDTERLNHVKRVLDGDGIAQSFLHYYLGIQEWKNGKRETARDHFQLARDLNPRFTAITNNLAMAIAEVSTDRAELDKALAMMDPLLQEDPANPWFLDTRSQVYARLGRLREAVRDLELALPKAMNKNAIHGTLSGLYQKLGMDSLATRHSLLAGEGQ